MSFPLFQSGTWPTDPTMPSAAPEGYVTPTAPPAQGGDPPITEPEMLLRRNQFYELIFQRLLVAIKGFFGPGAGQAVDQVAAFFNQIGNGLQDLMDALFEAATRVPIVGVLIDQVRDVITNLLNIFDPLNAGSLWGLLRPSQVGLVPGSSVQSAAKNLLVAPDFPSADVVEEDEVWSWDGGQGLLTPGSLKVVAAGRLEEMLSNEVPVAPRQKLRLSIFVQWESLVYTGTTPIIMGVTEYLDREEVMSKDLAFMVTPPASSNWVELFADYEVPESGVDEIRMRFKLPETTTAGTVWWDQGREEQTEPGTSDNLVQNLLGYIGLGWTLDDANDAIAQQVQTLIGHSVEISKLWEALDLSGNPAAFDNFNRSGPLGGDWDVVYAGGNGSWGTDGSTAIWFQTFNGGTRESICIWQGEDPVSQTDYQTNEAIYAGAAVRGVGLFGSTDVVARVSADKMSYIRFRIRATNEWELCKFVDGVKTVLDSGTLAFTPGAGSRHILIAGDLVSATPRHYTCIVNSTTITSGDFGDVDSHFGVDYRRRGFGGRAEGTIFSPQAGPARINDFIGRDTA